VVDWCPVFAIESTADGGGLAPPQDHDDPDHSRLATVRYGHVDISVNYQRRTALGVLTRAGLRRGAVAGSDAAGFEDSPFAVAVVFDDPGVAEGSEGLVGDVGRESLVELGPERDALDDPLGWRPSVRT
jgi:hypothetical protein